MWISDSIRGEDYADGYPVSQIKNLMSENIINHLTNSDKTTPLLV